MKPGYKEAHKALNSLTPEEVRDYLLAKGWNSSPFYTGELFFCLEYEQEVVRIPRLMSYVDYSNRMAEVIQVICEVENRSQYLHIHKAVEDIKNAQASIDGNGASNE